MGFDRRHRHRHLPGTCSLSSNPLQLISDSRCTMFCNRRPKLGYVLVMLCAVGCSHTDPYPTAPSLLGPESAGPEIRLTWNADQDYWPLLTGDSTSFLYEFVDSSQYNLAQYRHRCLGLMPLAGGTRRWQWCDNGAAMRDSLNSFTAYAIGHNGQLLYVEAVGPDGAGLLAREATLWLADTATPFRRIPLLVMPVVVGDSTINSLGDLSWTGETEFTALGQRMIPAEHCVSSGLPPKITCPQVDTVWYGVGVVRGTITSRSVTLRLITGTEGATGYSLTGTGAIAFTRRNTSEVFIVPPQGGIASSFIATTRVGVQLSGITCNGAGCLVAVAPITLWASTIPGPGVDFAKINGGLTELRYVKIPNGDTTVLLSKPTNGRAIYASPVIAPSTGDVIVAYGKMLGHLQTFADAIGAKGDLYRYPGLLAQLR
jgi:hypothetical protein